MASEGTWQGSSLAALTRPRSRTWAPARGCAVTGCRTQLSLYNPEAICWVHQRSEAGLLSHMR